jgi:hypothetical protein
VAPKDFRHSCARCSRHRWILAVGLGDGEQGIKRIIIVTPGKPS